jgi:glycosyltransferase involved in cell wall biosynthesis
MLKKILLVYSARPPTIRYLRLAFERAGVEARCLYADENTGFDRLLIRPINKLSHNLRILPKSRNFFEGHPLSHMNHRSARLKAEIGKFDPDLVFLIRGISFRTQALAEARMRFAWWVEAEERVSEPLAEVNEFDWYFFMNSSSVEVARARGHPHVSYLSHAVDTDFFQPLEGHKQDLDFCFVGAWSEKRQRHIEALLDITRSGAIYGPRWQKNVWKNPRFRGLVKGSYIEGQQLVDLYCRSKIVLNITNWGKGEGLARSGMTMRVFEVPATGSFLLTDESNEMHDIVKPEVHVGTFSDVADFRTQFERYLRDDALRLRIAQQGMAHVRANSSYDHLAAEIIKKYEELAGVTDSPVRMPG